MPRRSHTRTLEQIRAEHQSAERAEVLACLERHAWRLRAAADQLAVTPSTMQVLIERHGLAELYAQHGHGRGRPTKTPA